MAPPVSVGDDVHTPLGKGIVREVRGGARLVVEISGRKVVVEAAAVKPVEIARKSSKKRRAPVPFVSGAIDVTDDRRDAPAEVDLHGLTVDEALARVDDAINDALLAGHARLRLIHGRSGGRIKAALHRHLTMLPPVRGFRIDPANAGVTVVEF
jgi:DNA mismatch repair protein MutS2